jgi:hypothetical protein
VTLDTTKAAEPTQQRCRPATVAKPGAIAVGWLLPALTPSPSMRVSIALSVALMLAAAAAQAMTIDAKALARFDASYVKCETQFPEMRGHRDEAYLSLWKVRLDDTVRAQLEAVRKGASYQAERRRVAQRGAKDAAAAASSPLEQQCQALWGEARRAMKGKTKP